MNDKIILPIFPLNGVILFPNTNLPLNIFEDRYLKMIDFSLSSNKKIGMIQTKESGELYNIGCVGKINSYEETADGRYLVNLIGESYFKVIEEKSSQNIFRSITAEISSSESFIYKEKKIDYEFKTNLINKYLSFANLPNEKIDKNFLNNIDTSMLIKFLAMSSPFSVAEKQMLLETYNLDKLANKVITLFDYYKEINNTKETIN